MHHAALREAHGAVQSDALNSVLDGVVMVVVVSVAKFSISPMPVGWKK